MGLTDCGRSFWNDIQRRVVPDHLRDPLSIGPFRPTRKAQKSIASVPVIIVEFLKLCRFADGDFQSTNGVVGRKSSFQTRLSDRESDRSGLVVILLLIEE